MTFSPIPSSQKRILESADQFKSRIFYISAVSSKKKRDLNFVEAYITFISNLSNDKYKASSKTIPPHSAI